MALYPKSKIKGLFSTILDVPIRTAGPYGWGSSTDVSVTPRGVKYYIETGVDPQKAKDLLDWLEDNAVESKVNLHLQGSFYLPVSGPITESIAAVKIERKEQARRTRVQVAKQQEKARLDRELRTADSSEIELAKALSTLKRHGLKVVVVEDKER